MGWPNEYNIIRHPAKRKECCIVSYNICLVESLIAIKLHTTRYNTIQHNTTRYNKMAKRVQHFIQHESCMMLYEMLYSFGRGLNKCCTIQLFFCFPRCCMMLYSFGHPMQICCTLLYSRVKKCCIVLYEMLHSFGHPSVKHD